MSDKYKVFDGDEVYFVTFTIVNWIKVLEDNNFKVWQDGNQAKLIFSNKFLMEKLNYIHNNPVDYGLCGLTWEYAYSSAVNYAEKTSLLDIELSSIW